MAKAKMWKCEGCGAPNPSASETCYSCKRERCPAPVAVAAPVAPLGAGGAASEPKRTQRTDDPSETGVDTCRYCGGEVPQGVMKCRHCGEWLSEEKSPDPPLTTGHKVTAATIAILFWFFGVILGCIFLLGSRKKLGRFYLQWTLIGFVLWIIVFFAVQAVLDTSRLKYGHNESNDLPVATTTASAAAPPPETGKTSEEQSLPPTLDELKTGVEEVVQDWLRETEAFQNDTVIRSEVHVYGEDGYDYSASVTSSDGDNEHLWLYVHRAGDDADTWEPSPSQ